jgi:hypothetical protein
MPAKKVDVTPTVTQPDDPNVVALQDIAAAVWAVNDRLAEMRDQMATRAIPRHAIPATRK